MSDWFDAESHADRAFEMYERGRWAEAEAELRKALALNPDQAEWHFNLGLTLEAAGREREALASYERAIELLDDDQPERCGALVAAGILANRLQRYNDAIHWFEHALKIDQHHEAAYAHMIESYIHLGDHDAAETTFYLAQQTLNEPSAMCLSTVAESLARRGCFEKAAWCLKEAIRHEPNMPRLRARLGAVSAAMGKPQRALQLFLRDLRDDPGNIDTLLDYGRLLVELGRLPEAAEKFRRVLELEPANVDAHMRLGAIAMQCKRYDRAHVEFELVLKLDPTYPRVRLALADALLSRRRLSEAQQVLKDELDHVTAAGDANETGIKEALDDDPLRHYGPDEWAAFGNLLIEARMSREAALMYDLALTDDSYAEDKRAELLRRLALAHFCAGDRASGAMASRRVLRIDPNCVVSMHNLALAALEDGRIEVAAGWVVRGMKINRHDDGLRRLRVRIWIARANRIVRRLCGLGAN